MHLTFDINQHNTLNYTVSAYFQSLCTSDAPDRFPQTNTDSGSGLTHICVLLRRNLNVKRNYMRLLSGVIDEESFIRPETLNTSISTSHPSHTANTRSHVQTSTAVCDAIMSVSTHTTEITANIYTDKEFILTSTADYLKTGK